MPAGNSTQPQPTFGENLLASLSISLLSFTGLACYITVMIVICLNRTDFNNSYFTLLIGLSLADCTALFAYAFYLPVATLLQSWPLGESFDWAFGGLHGVAWYASILFIMSITLNRYHAVCKPAAYAEMYQPTRVTLILFGLFCLALALASPQFLPCCHVRYFYASYVWSYDTQLPGAMPLIMLAQVTGFAAIGVLVFCYARIFSEYFKTQRAVAASVAGQAGAAAARRQIELALAVQFFFVGVCLVVYDLVFTALHALSTYRWHLFFISVVGVLNHSINPVVYVASSAALRKHLKTMMNRLKGGGEVEAVSATAASKRGTTGRTKTNTVAATSAV